MRRILSLGLCLASIILWLLPLTAVAEDPAIGPFSNPAHIRIEDYFPPVDEDAEYDASVPKPESVLGHEIGSHFARHDQVVAWFEALAEASDKVVLLDLGRTHEGRRQITAIISSVRNIDRLREVQRTHLASEPGAPLVTWHGYSIHGNEPSGMQAAMAVAWYLAASRDADVRALLRDTIVMIDPSLNPDGYGRFSSWANSAAGRIPVADPVQRERTEAWPGGRGNHYFFDLNRDWLLLQQPESVNRVRLLQKYRPHVMTDHHEMGSDNTFFFQPGVESRWHPMIPAANKALTEKLAAFHARALDRAERLYYRGESFDDFYPGKGSTWPDLQGTVGILFEQANTGGLVRDTRQGRITLPMAVHNHVLATLSTLTGAAEMADELKAFRVDYQERKHVPDRLSGAWIFDDGGDPSRAAAMVALIRGQGLTVFGITESVSAGGRQYLPDRAWVVPVLGPQAALVQTLFADVRDFDDSTFYDVSAWSLPHAFGVSASQLSRMPTRLDTESRVNRNYGVSGRTEAVAWVLPWDDFHAPAVLHRLQAAGVRARVALEPFESRSSGETVHFKRGSVVIHESDVPEMDERKRDFLVRIAAGDAPLVGLDSGLSEQGPDLGSPKLKPLTPVSIALVAGEGVNRSSAGSIWHALDHRLGLPVTMVRPDRLDAAFLSRHTHLILSDGDYEKMSVFGEPSEASKASESSEAIGRWVEEGGVLIVVRRAASWAQSRDWLPDPRDLDRQTDRFAYGEMADRDGAQQVGGAIVEVLLDETHPLAFGIARQRVGLMKRGKISLKAPWDNPFTVVGSYAEEPLLSGYLPAGYDTEISGTPAILAVPKGKGVIIAFADAPAFRAVWWVGQRLLSNAISFGSIIRAPSGTYGGGDDKGEPR